MTQKSEANPQIRVRQCTNSDDWDTFVEQNGGSPFTLWKWGDAVESYGHDRWFFAAYDGDEIVGAAPVYHIQSWVFGDKLVSVPFASRGPLVLDDARREATRDRLFDRIRNLADDLEVDFVSLRSRDLGSHEAYKHEHKYVTYEISVAEDVDEVWNRVKGSRRRHVRQARDNGVQMRVGESKRDLRMFFDLYLESMRGHGSPPHSFEFFECLWELFHDDGTMRLYLAEHDGDLVNAGIDFAFGDWVYHWKNVSDYEARDLDGGSLLVWKGLEWAAENGYETYDLGRTREGSGVYMFKKSFGGEKVWIDNYYYYPSGEITPPDPDQEKYERAKQVWRRLPLPVTRAVGPHIRKSISL